MAVASVDTRPEGVDRVVEARGAAQQPVPLYGGAGDQCGVRVVHPVELAVEHPAPGRPVVVEAGRRYRHEARGERVELASGTDADADPPPVEDPRGIDPFQRRDYPLRAVDQLLASDAQRDRNRPGRGRSHVEIRLMDVELVGEDVRRARLADRLFPVDAGVLQLDDGADPVARLPGQIEPEPGEQVVLVVAGPRLRQLPAAGRRCLVVFV